MKRLFCVAALFALVFSLVFAGGGQQGATVSSGKTKIRFAQETIDRYYS
jgi:hypothetical protein